VVNSHLSFSYCSNPVVNTFKIFIKKDLNFKSQEMNVLKNFIFSPSKRNSSEKNLCLVNYQKPENNPGKQHRETGRQQDVGIQPLRYNLKF